MKNSIIFLKPNPTKNSSAITKAVLQISFIFTWTTGWHFLKNKMLGNSSTETWINPSVNCSWCWTQASFQFQITCSVQVMCKPMLLLIAWFSRHDFLINYHEKGITVWLLAVWARRYIKYIAVCIVLVSFFSPDVYPNINAPLRVLAQFSKYVQDKLQCMYTFNTENHFRIIISFMWNTLQPIKPDSSQ